MAAGTSNPPPSKSSVLQLDERTGKPIPGFLMSKEWFIWLINAIVGPVGTSVQTFPSVTLTNQSDSIALTPVPLPSLASGLYRLTYYARVTTVATTSSSLQVTFSWTESSVALSSNGPTITGNTTTTVSSASILVQADAASPISYSTTYASNNANQMKYTLIILVEAV